MNKIPQIYLEPDFMGVFAKAQEEAERLGVNRITDILVLKHLLYTSESYMSDFIKLINISWDKVESAIDKEVNSWAKEARKNVVELPNVEETIQSEEDDIMKVHLFFDEDVSMIISKAPAFSVDGEVIEEISFILSMLDNASTKVERFFKKINLDILVATRYYEGLMAELASGEFYDDIRESYMEKEYSEEQYNYEKFDAESEENGEKFSIPPKLKSFVKVFKADTSEVSPILGRDEETENLTKVLLKAKKSNAILVGKPGVGKTAIIEHLAWLIENDKCVEGLKGKIILSLEVNDIIAGTTLRGMAEERFKLVSEFLANTNDVILFIDEIHNVIGAGNAGNEDKLDFANALKPILAREGIAVIGATTEEEYNRIFKKDGAFKRRFEKIVIREPKANEVFSMVKEQINRLSKFHGVSITKPVIEYIINVSGCFLFETSNPDRTLDLIDRCMATAKILGKKVVTRDIVLNNFNANFKLYSKISEQEKFATAYHEAGHYLVARYAKHFPKKALAVSILPADGPSGKYLGLTVYDPEDYDLKLSWDYDVFLDEIAIDLAGRVAEKMYTGRYTSGAGSDLVNATEIARKMLVKYGLSTTFSKRRNMENDLYEDKKRELDEEINNIIDKAYELAQSILNEHVETLEGISKALVEKGILSSKELEKVCKMTEGKAVIITKPEVSSN